MSYILDALKKSERDRQHGNAPDVYSQHAEPTRQRTLLPWALLLVSIIVLAVFISGWIFAEQQEPVVTAINAQAAIPATISNVSQSSSVPISSSYPTTRITTLTSMPRAPFRVQESGGIRVQDNTPNAIVNIHELPAATLQHIPAIKISAHLYSSKNGKGMVMINGQSLHIGESLSSGLKLQAIGKKDVVLSYRNEQFSIGVFESWQP